MNYASLLALHPNTWIDLPDAARYAGVPVPTDAIVDAVTHRELTATTAHPDLPGEQLIRLADVEAWRRRRTAAWN